MYELYFQKMIGEQFSLLIIQYIIRIKGFCFVFFIKILNELFLQALEDEIAEDEGLELDIVEQMRGMGLEEEGTKEPSLTKSNACFEKDSLSTKVHIIIKMKYTSFCVSFDD